MALEWPDYLGLFSSTRFPYSSELHNIQISKHTRYGIRPAYLDALEIKKARLLYTQLESF